ncbi:neurogenic locus notch -like protein [Brachionus plicatilis]|uniref:Neurogenic locus notch-like protein n=1 Tax=Brachionus plicatilis TaxID=10195 RepID=A0A3M7RQR7_BRAPC|nr:neurogenic locus notch -like protein [Brachionus plicatilis]
MYYFEKTDTVNFKSDESISEPFEEETLPLNDLPIETINIILSSDIDIADCLSNCSNRGHCVLLEEQEPEKFSCSCEAHFGGNKCQFDLRPCSSNPCLNNGTCKEVLNNTTSKTK